MQKWMWLLCVLMVELSCRYEGSTPLWERLNREALAELILRTELGMEEQSQRETTETTLPTPSPSPSPAPTPEPTPEPSPLPVSAEPEKDVLCVDFSGELYTKRVEQEVDLVPLLTAEPRIELAAEGPQILIYHTHGTEAYTASEGWEYSPTDEYHCTDSARNMLRVGEELKSALEERGYRVIHDSTLCDYPSYNGAYSRSELVVQRYLEEYPSLSILLDVHRDAIGEGEDALRTEWVGESGTAAQLMFVVGTGELGLEHPLWRENFAFALWLQGVMNAEAPGLARPIELVPERYNQQYSRGSLLLEIGSTGNTLPEALAAARAFAACFADVLDALSSEDAGGFAIKP